MRTLKDDYNLDPGSSANVFSNDFKADWSRFVKTFEI